MTSQVTTESGKASSEHVPNEIRPAVIKQFAEEIQNASDSVNSLRTRMAFTIWIGPYVVLGSVIVATNGKVDLDMSRLFVGGLSLAAAGYLALGYLAGRVERYALLRCNELRHCITKMATTGHFYERRYLDEVLPKHIVKAYLAVFLILLVCFFGVAVLVSGIRPRVDPRVNPPAKTSGETDFRGSTEARTPR